MEYEIIKEIKVLWFWDSCPQVAKAVAVGVAITITIQIIFKLIFAIRLRLAQRHKVIVSKGNNLVGNCAKCGLHGAVDILNKTKCYKN